MEQLEGALERRGTIERAKGILMERHGISDTEAFELLRDHSRAGGRRVIDVARAVIEGHALLPKRPRPAAPGRSSNPATSSARSSASRRTR